MMILSYFLVYIFKIVTSTEKSKPNDYFELIENKYQSFPRFVEKKNVNVQKI